MAAIQRFRLALLALFLVAASGVAGYIWIEGWSAFDALYMTVITLGGVGYQEVRPLSPAGRAFTVGLIVIGLGAAAYAAGMFAQVVVGEQLRIVLGRRRMERQLSRLSEHYIVCGWGRMGQELVEEFRRRKVPFVVVEKNPEKCRRLAELGILHVPGDASDDQILLAAGVTRARSLISVAPGDADNVFITLSARSLNPKLFIVARSVYEQDVRKLEAAGANYVISPYVIGARRIAAAVFHPTIAEYLDAEIHPGDLDWELDVVVLAPGSGVAGKTIRESGIREQTGCTVAAVREAGAPRFQSNPAPETRLSPGDTLIALGTPVQLRKLRELAVSGE